MSHTVLKRAVIKLGLTALASVAQPANAEVHHYRSLIVGERAAALGGAFSAIADDPTAVHHNPGGLALQGRSFGSASGIAYQSKLTVCVV